MSHRVGGRGNLDCLQGEKRVENLHGKILVDLAILNAKIPIGQEIFEGGIAIDDGKIYAIGKQGNLPRASKIIDAEDRIVLPGLIDVHTHLRDLQLAYKEDFYSGTCAALAGGFTTVFDMPNTLPLTNSSLRLKEKMEVARSKIVANVGFYSCFPKKVDEINSIAEDGAIGFKVYLHRPKSELDMDDDVLFQAFKRTKEVNKLVAVHAEDKSLVEGMERKLKNAKNDSYEAYLKVHPPKAEIEAVKRIIALAKATGVHIHFCHISISKALSLILKAKAEGLIITCEATPHHLLLSKEVMNSFGGIAIMEPPLRSDINMKNLWQSLNEGGIDIIASDHAPHTLREKKAKSVWDIPPGIPGLETTLPLLLTMVKRGRLSLWRLMELLAQRPAEIFKLREKGALKEGFDADLSIVDLKEEFTITSSKFKSKAKYSPFDGWKVVGKPVKTFVGGRLAMDEGEVLAKPGSGCILRL